MADVSVFNVVVGAGVVFGGIWIISRMFRKKPEPTVQAPPMATRAPEPDYYRPRSYEPPAYVPPPQYAEPRPNSGVGAGTAFAGGVVAGAAGSMLADRLRREREAREEEERRRRRDDDTSSNSSGGGLLDPLNPLSPFSVLHSRGSEDTPAPKATPRDEWGEGRSDTPAPEPVSSRADSSDTWQGGRGSSDFGNDPSPSPSPTYDSGGGNSGGGFD